MIIGIADLVTKVLVPMGTTVLGAAATHFASKKRGVDPTVKVVLDTLHTVATSNSGDDKTIAALIEANRLLALRLVESEKREAEADEKARTWLQNFKALSQAQASTAIVTGQIAQAVLDQKPPP